MSFASSGVGAHTRQAKVREDEEESQGLGLMALTRMQPTQARDPRSDNARRGVDITQEGPDAGVVSEGGGTSVRGRLD